MKLTKGKVYLRDIRNGRVHPYEASLAEMQYMEKIVGGEEPEVVQRATMHVSLTGLDRAAEFDRLAAMTPEQRKAELAKAAASLPKEAAQKAPAAPEKAPAAPEKAPAPAAPAKAPAAPAAKAVPPAPKK